MLQQNLNNKFNLVLCELFNRNIHGISNNEIQEVDGHYLVISKFDGQTRRLLDINNEYNIEDEFTDSDESDDENESNETFLSSISDFITFYNEYYNDNDLDPHIIIRNYENIITRPNYIKPEIAECIILETHHSVAILKTIWLKLILSNLNRRQL